MMFALPGHQQPWHWPNKHCTSRVDTIQFIFVSNCEPQLIHAIVDVLHTYTPIRDIVCTDLVIFLLDEQLIEGFIDSLVIEVLDWAQVGLHQGNVAYTWEERDGSGVVKTGRQHQ